MASVARRSSRSRSVVAVGEMCEVGAVHVGRQVRVERVAVDWSTNHLAAVAAAWSNSDCWPATCAACRCPGCPPVLARHLRNGGRAAELGPMASPAPPECTSAPRVGFTVPLEVLPVGGRHAGHSSVRPPPALTCHTPPSMRARRAGVVGLEGERVEVGVQVVAEFLPRGAAVVVR